jgi:hypothetical protein
MAKFPSWKFLIYQADRLIDSKFGIFAALKFAPAETGTVSRIVGNLDARFRGNGEFIRSFLSLPEWIVMQTRR